MLKILRLLGYHLKTYIGYCFLPKSQNDWYFDNWTKNFFVFKDNHITILILIYQVHEAQRHKLDFRQKYINIDYLCFFTSFFKYELKSLWFLSFFNMLNGFENKCKGPPQTFDQFLFSFHKFFFFSFQLPQSLKTISYLEVDKK